MGFSWDFFVFRCYCQVLPPTKPFTLNIIVLTETLKSLDKDRAYHMLLG